MSIKIGCFALVDPFSTLDHQLDRVRDWGFQYADVTDTGDGAVLGNHFGFSAVSSLDSNPSPIALGSGVIDIAGVYGALVAAGFDGYSTLEVGGDEAVLGSANFLENLGAER